MVVVLSCGQYEFFKPVTESLLKHYKGKVSRGNHRQKRLYKVLGPKMWNCTGRGALRPNLTGIGNLFCMAETCVTPQRPILELNHFGSNFYRGKMSYIIV